MHRQVKRCIFENLVLVAEITLALTCHGNLKIGVSHSWAIILDEQNADLIVLAEVDADVELAVLINVYDLLLLFEFINLLVVNFVHID